MNRLMNEKWSWVEPSHAMRNELLDALNDGDLVFTPGGQAMTLGGLCREMGEIEHSYVQAFKTFKQDFDYRSKEVGLESSVAKFKAWYQKLDDDMKATLSAFSDEDLTKTIERPSGYQVPIEMQLDIYLQAILIFVGKATIYLRAMSKPLPKSLQEWVW
jgi:hypothetical protein